MALSVSDVNWLTFVITIPKSYLTLVKEQFLSRFLPQN